MKRFKNSFFAFACIYSFRSLGRNRRRTTLTMLTVIFSVAVTIVGSRFGDGMMTLWKIGVEETGSGHAQIHAKGYWERSEGVDPRLTLRDNSEIEQLLAADGNVAGFTRRFNIEGIISPYYEVQSLEDDAAFVDKSIYFVGVGVDPDSELIVSPKLFNPENDAGSFVSNDQINGVTIGRGLATSLDLKIGSEASLMSQTGAGSVNAIDVIVVGIVDVPLPSFSKRVVYLHIDLVRRLLRLPDRYTELAVRLHDRDAVEPWVAGVKPAVASFEAEMRGWWEIEPIVRNVEEIFDVVIGTISILLFLSAALAVLNMIFVLVAERTVEIGTLMAIGATPRDVRILFTMEAGMIGVFGGLIGAACGNIAVWFMLLIGVPVNNPFSSGSILIHPTPSISLTALVAVAAILICVFSALAPAHKAGMVEPVQAFRGQLT